MNPQGNPNNIYNTLLFSSTPKKDQNTENTSFTSNIWPQSNLQSGFSVKGTKDTPYKKSRVRDTVTNFPVDIVHICSMPEYSEKCTEEIRNEDYILGRKRQSTPALGFGSTQPVFSGISSTNPSFGAPKSSFLSTQPSAPTSNFSQFGTTQSFFSQPQTNPSLSTQPSAFSTQQSSLSTQPSSLFTTQATGQPTTISTPFSSSQPSSVSTFPQNLFSKPQAPSQTTTQSLFGQSTVQPPSFTPSFLSQPTSQINNTQPTLSTPFPPSQSLFASPNITSQPFLSQPSINQPSFQQNITQAPPINYSDPYLISDIKFEKEKEEKPFSKKIEQPFFETEKSVVKEKKESWVFREPKLIGDNVYTIPNLENMDKNTVINNLVIVFEKKGRIEYLESIKIKDCSIENIKSKVFFSGKEVKISDNIGTGLNKRARVYVEGCYPYSRGIGGFIIGKMEDFPLKGVQERYIYGLKCDIYRKFVDYDCDKGIYVYEVAHF